MGRWSSTERGSTWLTIAVASAEIFAIGVLVSDSDCDKQPSYEYCGEGTKWF